MSITTTSVFYFGHEITSSNYRLDFGEGGGELTAELDFGEYTLTEFAAEVKRALEEAGALTYTVTVARATRIITIAATGNFEIKTTTGTHLSTSVFTLLGFSGADKTGAASYAGGAASGSAYTPQFRLQDYVPKENNQKPMSVSVIESATGDMEAVRFGVLERIEMNIKFATNINQNSNGPITNNASGVENLNTFMRYITKKYPVEFMPNSSATSTYSKVILESAGDDKNGTGYMLKEMLSQKLAGYYETGKLIFRVLS